MSKINWRKIWEEFDQSYHGEDWMEQKKLIKKLIEKELKETR